MMLMEESRHETERLKELGWTREDFVRALANLLRDGQQEVLRRTIRSEAERQPSSAEAKLEALREFQKSVAAR